MRLVDKMAELIHFKENGRFRGDIALLEYNGSFIIGDRAYAIARDSQIEFWENSSRDHPYPFNSDKVYVKTK